MAFSILKKRLLLIVLSSIFFLISLECTVRVFHFFYNLNLPNQTLTASPVFYGTPYKIMTVGNSFTYGSGAPPDESYPRHLQRTLDAHFKEGTTIVFNQGRIIHNTSLILEKLEADIQGINPNMIIYQVGEPNAWNSYGYLDFKKKTTIKNKIDNFFLRHFASYRFISFVNHTKSKLEKKSTTLFVDFSTSISEQRKNYRMLIEQILKCKNRVSFAGDKRLPTVEDQNPSIRKILLELEEAHPENKSLAQASFQFHHICEKDYEFAFKKLLNVIKEQPDVAEHYVDTFFRFISGSDFHKYYQRLYEIAPEYAEAYLESNQREQLRLWVISDLKKMVALSNKYKAIPVIVNYPIMRSGKARDIDNTLRDFAQENHLLFVDVSRSTQQIFSKDKNAEKNYYADEVGFPTEHLNGSGYKIVADIIFSVIAPNIQLNIN